MPLFSLFLFKKFFLFKPLWSKQAPGLSLQPSLAFSQESCSRPCSWASGFSRPAPCAGPSNLIVLKLSSYWQIFQCPLSLVYNLHMCWNTVGCLLCSSDQLGVSLVPRGSGLRSHLSCHHLPYSPPLLFLITVMGVDIFDMFLILKIFSLFHN